MHFPCFPNKTPLFLKGSIFHRSLPRFFLGLLMGVGGLFLSCATTSPLLSPPAASVVDSLDSNPSSENVKKLGHPVDRTAVMINDAALLESEITSMARDLQKADQSLLWPRALELALFQGIQEQLLLQEAYRRKIQISEERVHLAFEATMKDNHFSTPTEFNEAIQRRYGWTANEYYKKLQEKLMVIDLLRNYEQVDVAEEEVEQAYKAWLAEKTLDSPLSQEDQDRKKEEIRTQIKDRKVAANKQRLLESLRRKSHIVIHMETKHILEPQ